MLFVRLSSVRRLLTCNFLYLNIPKISATKFHIQKSQFLESSNNFCVNYRYLCNGNLLLNKVSPSLSPSAAPIPPPPESGKNENPVESSKKIDNISQQSEQQSQETTTTATNTEDQQLQDATTIFDDKSLTLFQKFKKMYKEYWYVLLPVHLVTSAFWFSGFFYMSKSGVDIVSILESYKVSETLINPLRSSDLGHVAVAYLLYKIATPARYIVTLSGTTFSIKYLVRGGYIKPIPSRQELAQILKDKRDDFKEKVADKTQEIKDRMSKQQ